MFLVADGHEVVEAGFPLLPTLDYPHWTLQHSPRATDASFDPQPGDWLMVGDNEEPSLRGRVIRREDNRVWAQLDLDVAKDAVA